MQYNGSHWWPTTTVNVCMSRTPVLAKFTSKWLQTQRRECNLLYELSDIDETLAQDQIDDIEEEKDYLKKYTMHTIFKWKPAAQ